MTKNFKTLEAKLPSAVRARAEAKAQQFASEMALDELREALRLTQNHLAKILGVNQSAISKLERRTDMYVSTLQDIIDAMGGHLEIRAVFPQGSVTINQFGRIAAKR